MGRRALGRRPSVGPLRLGAGRPFLPAAVCIDVEPDGREVDLADPAWRGFERILSLLPEFRRRLAAVASGPVRLSWFIRADPQIEGACGSSSWALEHFAPTWDELVAASDELDLHVHAWRADEERAGQWICDHGDPAWVAHCVDVGLASYSAHFGAPPHAYRGGDRFLSDAVIDQIRRAGVAVDVTVEPGMAAVTGAVDGERTTGSLPDYTEVPLDAYVPSDSDFRRARAGAAGGEHFKLVPLSAGAGVTLYPWAERSMFESWLMPRVRDRGFRHLAFAIRSDMALDSKRWETIQSNLELALTAVDRRVRFVGASELAATTPAG